MQVLVSGIDSMMTADASQPSSEQGSVSTSHQVTGQRNLWHANQC